MSQIKDGQGAVIGPGFVSPEFVANPFQIFALLRSGEPVHRFELPGGRSIWLVARFEEVVRALRDPRISSQIPRADENQRGYDRNPLRLDQSMLFTEGVEHTRLRALVSRGFTPRFIEGLRPGIEAIAKDLLDKVQARGSMDLMSDFAFPLPINAISDMLGVPRTERNKIREWSAALSDQMSADPDRLKKLADFAEYVRYLIEQKRQHPANDLISTLVEKTETGDKLSDPELIGMVSLLIFAGHETTSSLIGNGMLALLTNPDQLEKLRDNPALIPGAIEELLRFCGPALTTVPRFVLEDVEFGNQVFRAGDIVNVVIGAANRDSAQFTDPEDLDVARQIERHMAFGHGVHYCLGAPLARLEGQIAFSTLLSHLPNIRLAADPSTLVWRGSMVLRGPASLPVAF